MHIHHKHVHNCIQCNKCVATYVMQTIGLGVVVLRPFESMSFARSKAHIVMYKRDNNLGSFVIGYATSSGLSKIVTYDHPKNLSFAESIGSSCKWLN